MDSSKFSKEFVKIFSQASQNKLYGSIEVYFEAGRVTQVTQRIINKIRAAEKSPVEKEIVQRL